MEELGRVVGIIFRIVTDAARKVVADLVGDAIRHAKLSPTPSEHVLRVVDNLFGEAGL